MKKKRKSKSWFAITVNNLGFLGVMHRSKKELNMDKIELEMFKGSKKADKPAAEVFFVQKL